VKRSSLLRHLRKHGCYLKREGRSHSLWCNPTTGAVEAIPPIPRSRTTSPGKSVWAYLYPTSPSDRAAVQQAAQPAGPGVTPLADVSMVPVGYRVSKRRAVSARRLAAALDRPESYDDPWPDSPFDRSSDRGGLCASNGSSNPHRRSGDCERPDPSHTARNMVRRRGQAGGCDDVPDNRTARPASDRSTLT